MARETRIVNLSLTPTIFKEVDRMAREENKSRSEVVRDALRQYTKNERLWRYIYQVGAKTAKKLGIRKEDDINKLIRDFRKESN
jgi:CopG family transcriptional regulator/antitoxin EndoAI